MVHSSFVYIDSMFDSRYLTSCRQPTAKQLDKLRREGINGGPNFLTWFREHVNPDFFIYIIFNYLTNLVGSQCVVAGNVHADLRQLSYGSVTAKHYGRYDINGFCFRSTIFEASRPLAATTNTGVVTRVVDEEGHEIKDIPCSDLQIFQWKGTTVDAFTAYHPTQEEQTSDLLYMYSNMDEMEQYFV
jgi:hypothetical protein